MSGVIDSVRADLADHPRFTRTGEAFTVLETPFDARVCVSRTGTEQLQYQLTIDMPTLDAVVTGETVPRVVEDGWEETLQLRLEDAHQVASSIPDAEYTFSRDGKCISMTVTMRTSLSSPVPPGGLTALVGYAEGTYLEGVIPGYAYRSPVREMVDRAESRLTSQTEE